MSGADEITSIRVGGGSGWAGWRMFVPVAGVDPDSSAWMPLTVGS